MNITHHPTDEVLLDYASGALGESWCIAIATHLALCPVCREVHERMEALGGGFLETTASESATELSFESLLQRIDDDTTERQEEIYSDVPSGSTPICPNPLREYIGNDLEDVAWQRLGLGAYQYVIPTNDASITARLLRIPAGQMVPEHSHRGTEMTLVLAGSFSDTTGHYGRGDLQQADEHLEHQPVAAVGEDCICLAITDAPLRFRSLAARMVQPFLGI